MRNLVPWRRQSREMTTSQGTDDPFYGLWQDVNRVFDDFFSEGDMVPSRSGRAFSPTVDVVESDSAIEVMAELPGLDEKDVEISLGRDQLTIRGEKKQEREEKRQGFSRLERSYGSFSRTITLPHDLVDADKAEARFEKGVLTVKLPKQENAPQLSRRIPVKTG
jgi:HSP20 family protein